MLKNQDSFCGNCGTPRTSRDTRCQRCGRPFIDDDTTINPFTPTHVTPSNIQTVWNTSSSPYPISPTPQSTRIQWTTRLLIGQSVLVTVLIVVIIVLLIRPVANSNQQGNIYPTATTIHQLTNTPTPSYEKNLSSGNFNLFIKAFANALAEQDVASIEPHTDTLNFVVDCGQATTCDTGWYDLKAQLNADALRIALPQADNGIYYAPATTPCPDATYTAQASIVVGSYDNRTTMLVGHYGTATLGFTACCGGSDVAYWGWSALFLC